MKRVFFVLLVCLSLILGAVAAWAGGDQNQGETGLGATVLGSEAQGTAEQPRTGR